MIETYMQLAEVRVHEQLPPPTAPRVGVGRIKKRTGEIVEHLAGFFTTGSYWLTTMLPGSIES